jgi:hypothetical protein
MLELNESKQSAGGREQIAAAQRAGLAYDADALIANVLREATEWPSGNHSTG